MKKNIILSVAFLTGLSLIFIGSRFLIAPETAEAGYGIRFPEQGNYAFHYIKGIRDLFTGLLICSLIFTKQIKALGVTLAIGTLIPLVDMLIVLHQPYNGILQAVPHISAVILCAAAGTILLFSKTLKQA